MDNKTTPIHRDESLDLLWGAQAIGAYLGLDPRQVFYLLQNRKLPGIKCGQKWVASKTALKRAFAVEA